MDSTNVFPPTMDFTTIFPPTMDAMHVTNIFPDDMPAIAEKLRAKAQADHKARVSIDKLDDAHREVLVRAINNVLATDEAVLTYAQIIDGLPIADVAFDRRVSGHLQRPPDRPPRGALPGRHGKGPRDLPPVGSRHAGI